MSLFIKQPTRAKIKQKEKEDEKSIQGIEKTHNFVEKPDGFTEELTDGLLKTLNIEK